MQTNKLPWSADLLLNVFQRKPRRRGHGPVRGHKSFEQWHGKSLLLRMNSFQKVVLVAPGNAQRRICIGTRVNRVIIE